MTARLAVVPVSLSAARAHVERIHSHHHAPVGGLFAVGIADSGRLCCVAIVGRPVARMLDDGSTAEVTRVASDGTPHAASMCVGAAARAALALGYRRVVSYTLLGEPGTSYRAAGWRVTGLSGGGEWSREGRTRDAAGQPGAKVRWETGPDAAPLDEAADAAVRAAVGVVEVPARRETLPLLTGRCA